MSREEFIIIKNYFFVYSIVLLMSGVYYVVEGTFSVWNSWLIAFVHLLIFGVIQLYYEVYWTDRLYGEYLDNMVLFYGTMALFTFYCSLIAMVSW